MRQTLTYITKFRASENAVSPVVGTILMIAATVAIGATVYGALNGFGSDSIREPVNAVFTAKGLDTDGDGRTDRLKITYVTGPNGVAASDVVVNVNNGTATPTPLTTVHSTSGEWNTGDFVAYAGADTYYITVSILGTTVLDDVVTLVE